MTDGYNRRDIHSRRKSGLLYFSVLLYFRSTEVPFFSLLDEILLKICPCRVLDNVITVNVTLHMSIVFILTQLFRWSLIFFVVCELSTFMLFVFIILKIFVWNIEFFRFYLILFLETKKWNFYSFSAPVRILKYVHCFLFVKNRR